MGDKTYHEMLDEDQAEAEGIIAMDMEEQAKKLAVDQGRGNMGTIASSRILSSEEARAAGKEAHLRRMAEDRPKEPIDVAYLGKDTPHSELNPDAGVSGLVKTDKENLDLFKKRYEQLEQCTNTACSKGNYDANEYMRGMANGLILARAILDGGEPDYIPAPEGARSIELTPAEIKSGLDRVRWAEILIRQLPADHEGRNSWLLNYGVNGPEKPVTDSVATKVDPIFKEGYLAGLNDRKLEGKKRATQDWMDDISIMQQSVVLSSIRGLDGMRKFHEAKHVIRFYRRCVLVSAFDGKPLLNPYESGGGSFTGPWPAGVTEQAAADAFMNSRDEMPLHYYGHFMHGAQIIGYKHPDKFARRFFHRLYVRMAHALHLWPESEVEMDRRLSDDPAGWEEREDASACCSD